jgi:hypothetical protein
VTNPVRIAICRSMPPPLGVHQWPANPFHPHHEVVPGLHSPNLARDERPQMTQLVNVEIPRDGYGRPMVMPPKGTKRQPYRRTTTFVGAIEDLNGIVKWKARQVAYGMGQRRDLVMAAASTDPDDKTALGKIAEAAEEAAGSSAAATIGTAVHALTERIDHGKPLGQVPREAEADIAAYQKATAGIEYSAIETFRVHDDWKVAGTADRIGRLNGGRPMIMDIKTGKIDFPHKMAMQLAMYAHSVPYDIGSDTRTHDPDQIDMAKGIIIHLPAGQGICNLYEVDIARGWAGCVLAKKVWDWRGVKGLTSLVAPDQQPTLPATWETLITNAPTLDALREIWRAASDLGELTQELRALCTERSNQLSEKESNHA